MKVLEHVSGIVSNADMLHWLREDRDAYKRRGAKPPTNAAEIWDRTLEYLERDTGPHAPAKPFRSPALLRAFSAELRRRGYYHSSARDGHGKDDGISGVSSLTPMECVAIANLCPTNPVLLMPLVECWEQRYAEAQLQEICDIVQRCLVDGPGVDIEAEAQGGELEEEVAAMEGVMETGGEANGGAVGAGDAEEAQASSGVEVPAEALAESVPTAEMLRETPRATRTSKRRGRKGR